MFKGRRKAHRRTRAPANIRHHSKTTAFRTQRVHTTGEVAVARVKLVQGVVEAMLTNIPAGGSKVRLRVLVLLVLDR